MLIACAGASTSTGANELVGKSAFRDFARAESQQAGLPFDVVDAVMAIESGYDPSRVGSSGEIGLMQVRPGTAFDLGFRGTDAELASPAVNIHLGVMYLAQAWKIANGDLCRTLMKYRAGHANETMSPLSATYCLRAQARLSAQGPWMHSPVSTIGSGRPTVAELGVVSPRLPPAPTFRPGVSAAVFFAKRVAYVREVKAILEANRPQREIALANANAKFFQRQATAAASAKLRRLAVE